MMRLKNFLEENKTMLQICLGLLIITALTLTAGLIYKNKVKETNVHNYVTVTVVDKYINPGYAGFYQHKSDEYVIVARYEVLENGVAKEYTIRTVVDPIIYDSYNIEDPLGYCLTHNKLFIYENK